MASSHDETIDFILDSSIDGDKENSSIDELAAVDGKDDADSEIGKTDVVEAAVQPATASMTRSSAGTPPVTLNDSSGIVSTAGLELKTSNATLKIPKGSLDKETFIHLFELGNEVVKSLEKAGISEGVDYLMSPLISVSPASTYLRRDVHLKVRNLFAPYPLEMVSGRPVVLINKSGANDKNATDGWENVADSRLYTSVKWRFHETGVDIETKVLGEFIVLVLFSTPLPTIINFVREQVFLLQFSVVLSRRVDEVDAGTLVTLVVTSDPARCTHLVDAAAKRDRFVVFGPVTSLFPLCDGYPLEFCLLESGEGERDSINLEKCRSPTTGQQRSIFISDRFVPPPTEGEGVPVDEFDVQLQDA